MKYTEKHELTSLLSSVIPKTVYKGVIVELLVGGYRVLGQEVTSPFEVDMIIKKSIDNLEASIERGRDENNLK